MLEARPAWARPEGRAACEGAPRLAQPPKHSGSEVDASASDEGERCAAPPSAASSWLGLGLGLEG